MKKQICIVLVLLLLLSIPAFADELFVPDVSAIRVNKFELQLVGNRYWIAQKGEWDWDAHPLTLRCTFEDDTTNAMLLNAGTPGRAWVLCDKSSLERLAAEKGEYMRWTLSYEENGEIIELDTDSPLTESAWAAIALLYHIWYADGALWYAGGNDSSTPPDGLTKIFSDGHTETVALPALNGNDAYMLLSPSEIEADLADPNIGWVTYSLN